MSEFKLSRTVALWVIKVTTKIVRDGLGSSTWMPLSTSAPRFDYHSQLDYVGTEFSPERQSWINAMFSMCRMLCQILYYQVEPEVQGLMLEDAQFHEVSSVEALSGMNELDVTNFMNDNKENE
jgi:hypothetical protein